MRKRIILTPPFFSFLLIIFIITVSMYLLFTPVMTTYCYSHKKKFNFYKFKSFDKEVWSITNTTIIENKNLIVDKSIFIRDGGTLILRNSTLSVDLSYDGEYWIEVCNGGNLTIINSTITALNTTNNYYIKINSGAEFYMDHGEISYAGYSWEGHGEKAGIWINTSDVVIKNSTIHHNLCGLLITNMYNGSISNNLMTDNNIGMLLLSSYGNLINNNILINNLFEGLALYESHNNDLINNILINNTQDKPETYMVLLEDFRHFAFYGLYVVSSHNNSIVNSMIAENLYGLYLLCSDNNSIMNNVCPNNTIVGIKISLGNNNIIANNTISYSKGGIDLYKSCNNIVSNNTVFSNTIELGFGDSYDNIIDSNILFNGTYGIYMEYSYQNDITRNSIINNTCGICLFFSERNNVANNTLASNNNLHNIYIIRRGLDTHKPTLPAGLNNKTFGILICYSQSNRIVDNTIANCTHAIYLYDSYGNTIYRNTMLNNTFDMEADQPTLIRHTITILISFGIVFVMVIVIKSRKVHKK